VVGEEKIVICGVYGLSYDAFFNGVNEAAALGTPEPLASSAGLAHITETLPQDYVKFMTCLSRRRYSRL